MRANGDITDGVRLAAVLGHGVVTINVVRTLERFGVGPVGIRKLANSRVRRLHVVHPLRPLRTDVGLLVNQQGQGCSGISGSNTLVQREGSRELSVVDEARVRGGPRTDLASLNTPRQLAVRSLERASPMVNGCARPARIPDEITRAASRRVGLSLGGRDGHVPKDAGSNGKNCHRASEAATANCLKRHQVSLLCLVARAWT